MLTYFPCLAPEDTEFCDSRLQVQVGEKTCEDCITSSASDRACGSPTSDLCQRDRSCLSLERLRLVMGINRAPVLQGAGW